MLHITNSNVLRLLCRNYFWEAVNRNPNVFKNPDGLVYDDQAILYSSFPLNNLRQTELKEGDQMSIELNYKEVV